jgi:hypothetical protein
MFRLAVIRHRLRTEHADSVQTGVPNSRNVTPWSRGWLPIFRECDYGALPTVELLWSFPLILHGSRLRFTASIHRERRSALPAGK